MDSKCLFLVLIFYCGCLIPIAESALGGQCTDNTNCTTPAAVCNTSLSECVCESGYVQAGDTCEAEAVLGGPCTVNETCTTPNSACNTSSSKCVCESGYMQAGDTCEAVAGLGGSCTVDATCTTQNAECNGTTPGSTCICSSGFVRSGDVCEAVAGLGGSCTVGATCTTLNAECSGTTSGSTCICRSGYVRSGSVCEAVAGLGGTCTVDATCTTQNAVCSGTTSGSTCICRSGYVRSGSVCEAVAGLGGTCTVDATCTTQNAVCSGTTSGSTCICRSGYVRSGSVCEAVAGLGGTCTVDATCTTPNAVCSGTTSGSTCICRSGYVKSGSVCEAVAGLGGSCTVNATCTTLNALCSGTTPGSTCICSSGYVKSGDVCEAEASLGGSCTVNAACTTPNAVCSGTTSGSTCICRSGYVRSGSVCVAEASLGGSCTVNAACTTPNAVCSGTTSGSTCICRSGYVKSGSVCEAEAGLGGTCTVDATCTTQNAVCSGTTSGSTCICRSGYVRSGSVCEAVAGLGGTCTVDATCTTQNAVCSGTTSGSTCICRSGYVKSGSVCEAVAGLGGTCTVDATCTTQNAVCSGTTSGSTCICRSGYVRSGSVCEAEAGLGGSCTVNAACTTPNAVCSGTTSGSTCICRSGYVRSGSVCEAEAGLGGSCTVNAACTTPNAVCSGTTSGSTCICRSGYVRSGSVCVAEASLGGSCTVNAACTTPNAVCSGTTSGSTCICRSGYVKSGSVCEAVAGLGGSCTVNATCTTLNALCSGTTPGSTCICSSGYVKSGDVCEAELGTACSASSNCADPQAVCLESRCVCDTDHFDDNGQASDGGTCTLKVALEGQCPQNVQNWEPCSDPQARCDGGKCLCISIYYDNNGAGNPGGACELKKDLGYPCSMDEACKTSENAICAGSKCACQEQFYDNNGESLGGQCMSKIGLNQQCPYSNSYSDQCLDPNALCRFNTSTYRCQCKGGYSESGGICNPDQGVGEQCLTGSAGDCSDANAECTSNVCTCKDGYYHDRGLATGGNCNSMTDLQVSGLFFTDVQLNSFTVTWNAPTGKSEHISGYSVQWWPKDNSNGRDSYNVGNATSYGVATGITAGKAYRVTVTSRNEVTEQNSPRTITSQVKEQAAKPNVPGNINLSSSNLDAGNEDIFLYWTSPAVGGVSGYTVLIFEGDSERYSYTFYSPQGTINFSGMLHGQRYNVSITALSQQFDDGKTVASDAVVEEIKTIVKKPGPPLNVRCSEIFDEYITLRWDEPTSLNGEDAEYHITAVNDVSKNVTNRTSTSTTTMDVHGLSPGSYYTFEVIVENEMYNSSMANTSSYCKTKAKMSDPPRSLNASAVTRRSFDVSWRDPENTYSEENFGYVLQVKDSEGVCVKEEIYRCSSCTETFQVGNLTELCPNDTRVVFQKNKDELSGIQTVIDTDKINPDTVYDISVTAINGAGRGHKANITVTTLEEIPQKPVIERISAVTATSFTVTWNISGPRPGKTNFTIDVTAASPAKNMTIQVRDVNFNIRTMEITGLEEYWNYTITVTASTGVGRRASDVSNLITTTPSAPGNVSKLKVDRTPGGSYSTWEVSWLIPAILDRNSIIIGYRITHNGTNAASLKTVDAKSQEGYRYIEIVQVVPEKFYTVEVFAVNNMNEDGTKETYSAESLAGVPKPPQQDDFKAIQAPSPSQKSITVTIDRYFLLLNSTGTPRDTGLLCCAKAKCDEGLKALSIKQGDSEYRSMNLSAFRSADNWQKASKNGYTLYRPNKDTWVKDFDDKSAGSGRRRRATVGEDITYTIGSEQCTNANSTEYCNGPLVESTSFSVYVVVCTNGGCLVSPESGPHVTLAVPEDGPQIGLIVGIIVGVVVALAIVVVVIVFLMRRRSKQPTTRPGDPELPPTGLTLKNIPRKRRVKLTEFNDHVEKMHRDSNLMFSSEYEDLKALSAAHSHDAANKDENKLKNRYINILPFDHSIVKLSSNGEDDCQDYINANYLPGYKSKREYIGCQGPIPGTIDDHWRMIWEQNVSVIVMLTLCKEGQKVKCEQYWPDEVKEAKQYGDIIVEVSTYSNLNTYDYRIFTLTVGMKTMKVKHFHFLSWMDFSANVQTNTMIEFLKEVRAYVQPPDTTGPIIVHCSAGVGRTGTYITLDHLMQFIEDHDIDEESVDIFSMVLALRENRPHMVQTEQQYIFIHDCLKEIIERKRASQNIYENRGFEADDDEENFYQNTQAALYENVDLSGKPMTNL